MPSIFSCVLGVTLLSPVVAIRKTARASAAVNVTTSNDCSSLTDIVVGERNFGEAFRTVCNYWPENLGEFPVTDINRAKELMDKAMAPGGAWDQIKEIRENRGKEGFCWRNETLRLKSDGECEVMSLSGKCYGKCPMGYRPGLLSGIFRPACTTGCSATTHTVSCGFGCATSGRQCGRIVLEQAMTVARGVGRVVGFINGDERIATVVDAVLNLAEFFLSAFPPIYDAIMGAIDIIANNEEGVMVAVILYEYLVEVAPTVGESIEEIRDAIKEFSQIIANLAVEKRRTGRVGVDGIIREILGHGEDYLDLAVRATKAFSHEKCAISADVAFTIETVGDDRLMGPWIQLGENDGKPKYVIAGDRSTAIQFVNDTYGPGPRWVMFSDNWIGWFGRRYLYQSKVTSADYPTEGWTVLQGSLPTPEFVPFSA